MEKQELAKNNQDKSSAETVGSAEEGQTATLAPPPFKVHSGPPAEMGSGAIQSKKDDAEEESKPVVYFYAFEISTRGGLAVAYRHYRLLLEELYNQTPATAVLSNNYEVVADGICPDKIAEYSTNPEGDLTEADVSHHDHDIKLINETFDELNRVVLKDRYLRLRENHTNLRAIARKLIIDDETKEMYRIAFEKGNKAAYEKIGKIILEVSGASSKINGKVTDVHKVLAKAGEYVNLKEITGIASEIESVTKKVSGAFGKVKDIYEDIHKLINVVNVLSGDHKTYENAVGGIELMGEAAGEFYGKVPGMGWYGEYISMSVSRATKTMNKLHESVTKQERDLRNEGDMQNRDYLYYNSPGGIPTFRFMKKVMQAGHPGQIKMEDVTSDIEDFFEEHNESKINNALGGNKDNKMPVKHKTWGDDKIKKREFKSWVFKNRKQIWYMLYGKTNINKAIREESGASKPFQLKD